MPRGERESSDTMKADHGSHDMLMTCSVGCGRERSLKRMTRGKWVGTAGAVLLTLSLEGPALSAETFKVAVIDQQAVMEKSKSGRRIHTIPRRRSRSSPPAVNGSSLPMTRN